METYVEGVFISTLSGACSKLTVPTTNTIMGPSCIDDILSNTLSSIQKDIVFSPLFYQAISQVFEMIGSMNTVFFLFLFFKGALPKARALHSVEWPVW